MKTLLPKFLIVFSLGCFNLSPTAQAVSPPPDGGYPGGNTAEGDSALASLTSGFYNNAVGFLSLLSLQTGSFNTADGAGALLSNTASENTATGAGSLFSNTTGGSNTANGAFALFSNAGGSSNTAIGDRALFNNATGGGHTAVGAGALESNISLGALAPDGFGPNTAIGVDALSTNTSGNGNTAVGAGALFNNDVGGGDTAIGLGAGSNITGTLNICIGTGVSGVAGENNTIRIGDNLSDTQGDSACFIGGIFNQQIDVGSAVVVGIDNTGKIGTAASSRRFKQDIKPMDKASEAILALKPVAFHYKGDAKNTPCFGLIAEEVAEVNPDLVARNKNGEIYTVRYEQINAMLLNEFLKEHHKVDRQQKEIEALKAELTEQRELIQKVSDKLEISKSAPHVVAENP